MMIFTFDVRDQACLKPCASAGGAKRAFPPLEVRTKTKIFENLKLEANFRVIRLIVAITVCLPVYDFDIRTAKSQVHCSGATQ